VRLQGHIKHAIKILEDMPCNWDVQSLKLDQDSSYTVGLRGYLRPSLELLTLGNSSLIPLRFEIIYTAVLPFNAILGLIWQLEK
jgi:hypothetical protein